MIKLTDINLVTLPSPFLIDDLAFPNLGVLYLSAALKQQGYGVSIIDLHGHSKDWKQVLAKAGEADVWGISSTTPEFPIAIEAMREIKSASKAPVVIGGPMATSAPEECLKAGFDHVIVGEGERAIIRVMKSDRSRVIEEPQINNLDEIPFPDRNAIDMHRYHYETRGKSSTTIMTSRGCYWSRCRFCCQIWGEIVRYRSSQNVIKELEEIWNMGFGGVMMVDDAFFSYKKRDFEICNGLKRLGMPYRCLTRSDLVNEHVARVAADTGCVEVLLGIETGSRQILSTINKGVTIEQHENAIKLLKEHGIKVKGLFMIGLPGETRETIKETEEFVARTKPDICEFTIYTPYPNSEFWNNKYDIAFNKEEIVNGGAWYKGIRGSYVSRVSTSCLNADEIVKARDDFERRYGI